jgi:cell division protein FtsB
MSTRYNAPVRDAIAFMAATAQVQAEAAKADELLNNNCARSRTIANQLSRELRATEDRINELEAEIEHFRDRAFRAETWLQGIQREIEQTLIAPTAATRLK